MWTYIHEKECSINIDRLWDLYSNVENWKLWDEDIKTISLDGEFKVGTKGVMTMDGQDPMNFSLTVVEPKKCFIDETVIEPLNVTIVVGHFIEQKTDDRFYIRHSVIIKGENADMVAEKIGESFTVDIPKSMEKLIKLSSKG